jgi:hypothetical protein
MNWTFTLNGIEIDEPLGFTDLVIRARRDDNWHGVFFEASTSDLTFYGDAAQYLKEQKNLHGFAADVTFNATWECDDGSDVLTGKLDFRRYREGCGNECLITLPVEQQGCIMTLRNRYDQKVDLSNGKSFNGITNLENYSGLNFSMELPAQEMQAGVEGYVSDEGDAVDLSIFAAADNFYVRPTYGRQIDESINQSELLPSVFAAADNGLNDPVISPVLLFDDNIGCFNGTFDYSVRLKGSYNIDIDPSTPNELRIIVAYGEFPGALTILHNQLINNGSPPISGTFDVSYSGTLALPNGDGFYVYLHHAYGGVLPPSAPVGNITFTKETYVNISALKSCLLPMQLFHLSMKQHRGLPKPLLTFA